MGKKYLETKEKSLESSVLGIWQEAAKKAEEVKLDEKMKPVDPKTAKMIAKIIARNKLDYNFEYGLSKNNIADIKKQGGKPPRGVGPMGGGSLYDLLAGLGDTDNDIYLDGADLVDGAKTIAKWKGMTVGDMLKKARLQYEEVDLDEGKYLKYSDLLLKKARLIDKKGPDSNEVKEVNKEIKAEMKKLGIKEGVDLDEKKILVADPKTQQVKKIDAKDWPKYKKKGYVQAESLGEASGGKEEYKKFFNAALKKFKVKSPAELKGDNKKKFYDYIDANWEADNEKAEDAMAQVREFKIQSMKAALASIWGMKEGKNPFKKEEEEKPAITKGGKTLTGKKPAEIDVNPKIKV